MLDYNQKIVCKEIIDELYTKLHYGSIKFVGIDQIRELLKERLGELSTRVQCRAEELSCRYLVERSQAPFN